MHRVVISDTSCLILLNKIGEINLLPKLYNSVITTPDVAKEFDEPLPEWIEIVPPADKNSQKILELHLGSGEASSIVLALQYENCTVILDDLKARKIALNLGIKITGTLGILVKAKEKGFVKAIKPLLEKLKDNGFRISAVFEYEVLKLAGEL
jgi:predicted nucleic acid-binding protein